MNHQHIKFTGIYSKQAHVDIPNDLYEEEHGRKGFFGRVSHLYHQHPPVNWSEIEGELRPMCSHDIFSNLEKKNDFIPLLSNQETLISCSIWENNFDSFFRNADFDELIFIHQGLGHLETTYGHIPISPGDYVVIPRGTTYKCFVKNKIHVYKIETTSEFEQPDRGLLGPNSLYDQGLIFIPEAEIGSEQNKNSYKVQIKRLGKLTTVTYPFNPLDVKGWKGSVYPWKLSIYDIAPIMSHRYHIPPSGHTTFVAKSLVVCSFVARPLESSEHKVLKVPFYHSNIDFDEVIFYHKGSFFSRDHINPGAITFHPQGIHHGPHPNAYKNSDKKLETDEFSVMVDSRIPLRPTPYFEKIKDNKYDQSWKL